MEPQAALRSVRVFAPPGFEPALGGELQLTPDESQYLVRVRRCRIGERVSLFSETGPGHIVEILDVDRRRSRVRVLEQLPEPQAIPALRLCVGLPDPAPLLQIITDATELGAQVITLLTTARSEGRRPSEARLGNTVRAAQRQSARPRPPMIEGPVPLNALLDELKSNGTSFVFGQVERPPTPRPAPPGCETVVVGPPGGFTPDEHGQLSDAGGVGLHVSPWVLRTETATTALLACVALTAPEIP